MAIAAPLNTLVIFDSPQFFITFQNELSANNINLGACLLHDQDSLQKALEKAWDIVLRPLHPDESGLAQWRQQSQARDRLHRVLDASPDIVFMLTLDGKLLYNNEACRVQFGLDQGALQTAASLLDILPPKFSQQLALQILPMLKNTGEWKGGVLIDSNNQSQPESILSLVCFSHQGPADLQPYLSFVGRDISQQKQLERALLHQATHDELTTLPNRHSLLDHLQDAFARSRRSGKSVALLFMDVDKFKRINDSLGHLAGDELLRKTALRLRSCLRANDLVSRLGGDEFTISIEDLEQPEDVITVISKIYQVFPLPIDVHGQE
ncbi:MAG: sensor domain-containing diguanylate cyclase, partial [Anaerolineae bacterium]|nr:sensor domain-containing diguanylate cyclase [Anaerolineae bacterium]